MAIKQTSGYCNHCRQPRPFAKNTPNHVLHFVVSLFTLGLWVPVWIVLTIKAAGTSAICTACGLPKGAGAAAGGSAVAEAAATQEYAPGWYPDSEDAARQRYWDGTQWTDQRRASADSEATTSAAALDAGEAAGGVAQPTGSDSEARPD